MEESTAIDVEEESKFPAVGILAYPKVVVNQTSKSVNGASQGSNYPKGVEQGSWSSGKAGDTQRPTSALPGYEYKCTPPHRIREITGQRNSFYAIESGSEKSRPHLIRYT